MTTGVHNGPIIDLHELDREIYRRDFRDFIPHAFDVLEAGDAYAAEVRAGRKPSRFVPGWHIDAIAEHLQAVAAGEIRRLLVNIPPGSSKSVLACVLWPAWLWARDPKLRFIFSSYSEAFTKRDARKTKALVTSDWYKALFPQTRMASSPDTQMEQHTTAGGERHGASTNSGVTGRHANGVVEDDPIKLQDAASQRARNEAWDYHSQALGFRLLPEGGWRVVIMQRLHEDDVSGRILEREREDYVHLCLPMEYEATRKCVTTFFKDPRTADGELLWPSRMSAEFVAEKKRELGPSGWAGQAQQRPAPISGNAVKREYLQARWTTLPDDLDLWTISADLTFKLQGTSYAAIGVWAKLGARRFLVDQIRSKMDFNQQISTILELRQRWPEVSRVLIEEAANGHAAINVLRDKIPGVIGVRADRSKEARLAACLPNFEAKDIVLPHDSVAPWVADFVEELVTFPNAANDDQVDQATMALLRFRQDDATTVSEDLDMGLMEGTRESPWRF